MEALTALSLAAAVAQFIDFGFKIVGNAREIYGSLSGATEENQTLATAALEVQQLSKKLITPRSENPTEEEEALSALIADCRSLSGQLLNLLDKIKPRIPSPRYRVAWLL